MSQAICLFSCPAPFAFRADCEDVSGGVLVSAPLRGAARGVFTGPFVASLWGCLRRWGAGFNAPKGSRQECFHGPVRGQFVGMSQA
eukprot:486580-Pyramimonas_sp.AAC.1